MIDDAQSDTCLRFVSTSRSKGRMRQSEAKFFTVHPSISLFHV